MDMKSQEMADVIRSHTINVKDADILLVEVGSEDYQPSIDDMDQLSELFLSALDEQEKDACPVVVVVNRCVDIKAQALKIQEAIDLVEKRGE